MDPFKQRIKKMTGSDEKRRLLYRIYGIAFATVLVIFALSGIFAVRKSKNLMRFYQTSAAGDFYAVISEMADFLENSSAMTNADAARLYRLSGQGMHDLAALMLDGDGAQAAQRLLHEAEAYALSYLEKRLSDGTDTALTEQFRQLEAYLSKGGGDHEMNLSAIASSLKEFEKNISVTISAESEEISADESVQNEPYRSLRLLLPVDQRTLEKRARNLFGGEIWLRTAEGTAIPPTYVFFCANAAVEFSKNGGKLLRLLYSRSVEAAVLDEEACLFAAETFLKQAEIYNCRCVSVLFSVDRYYLLFEKNTDSKGKIAVRMTVAADNGGILAFDSSGYWA